MMLLAILVSGLMAGFQLAPPSAVDGDAADPDASMPTRYGGALLREAEARIYKADAHGLQSLSFDVHTPLGKARCAWHGGDEVTVDVIELASKPSPMAPKATSERLITLAESVMLGQRASVGAGLLDVNAAEIVGQGDGMLCLRAPLDPAADAKLSGLRIEETLAYLKPGQPLERVEIKAQTEGGAYKSRIDVEWDGVDGVEGLFLARQTATASVAGITFVSITEFSYVRAAGIVLQASNTTRTKGPFESTATIECTAFVVNGTPVDVEPVRLMRDTVNTDTAAVQR